MRMNNVEVHMKKDNRVGDIIKDTFLINRGMIKRITKDPHFPYVIQFDYVTVCLGENDFINLSAIGRKAALASSKKVGRDSKGRFIKMSHGRSVHLSSTLSGQRELLRNHENRIRELEKKLLNDQPKYINCGGAGGCNGTC